jgi:hypothetical protein
MKFDHYEYAICSHWVSAIINDDYTGLADDEEKTLRKWLTANEQRGGHWDVDSKKRFLPLMRCQIFTLIVSLYVNIFL